MPSVASLERQKQPAHRKLRKSSFVQLTDVDFRTTIFPKSLSCPVKADTPSRELSQAVAPTRGGNRSTYSSNTVGNEGGPPKSRTRLRKESNGLWRAK